MPLDWLSGSQGESISDLIVRKKYARAIELLRLHLQKQGRSAVARLQLADTLVMAGRSGEAVPIFLALADEFAADGFLAKAVAALKRVEKIEPGRPDVNERLKAITRRQQGPPLPLSATPTRVASPRYTEIGIEEVGVVTWTRLQRPGGSGGSEPAAPPLPSEQASAPVETQDPIRIDVPLVLPPLVPQAREEKTASSGAAAPPEASLGDNAPPKIEPTPEVPVSAPALSTRIRGAFRRFLALLPEQAPGASPREEAPRPGPTAPTSQEASPEAPPAPGAESGPGPEVGLPPQPAAAGVPEDGIASAGEAEPREAATPAGATEGLPAEPLLDTEPVEAMGGDPVEGGLPSLEIVEPPAPGRHADDGGPEEDLPWLDIEEQAGAEARPVVSDEEPPASLAADIGSAVGPGEGGREGEVGEGAGDFFAMPEEVFQERVTDLIGELLQPLEETSLRPAHHESPQAHPPLFSVPFFEGLSEEDRLSVIQGLGLRSVEAGDIILTEGGGGQSLFLLTAGSVKVYVRDAAGHNVPVGILGEGDVFGEIALLHGRPRTATITAVTRGEMLELDQQALARLAKDHPQVVARIEAFSQDRQNDRELAALHAVVPRPEGVEVGVADLDTHFGSKRLEPRMRLRLADAFLKAGDDHQAVQVLVELADDLVRHNFVEKAVALLKKVEEIQCRGGSRRGGARPVSSPPAPVPGSAGASDRFHDWLLDLVRATVQRHSPRESGTDGRLDSDALRAYGRGLLASNLFQGLSEEELLATIRGLRLLTVDPGDIILTEGEAGQSVFILATGRVKVFVRNRAGQDVAIDELSEGAFFGEMAAISNRSRAATVTAVAPSTLLELDAAALQSIVQAHPGVRDVLENVFIERAADPRAASARGLEGP